MKDIVNLTIRLYLKHKISLIEIDKMIEDLEYSVEHELIEDTDFFDYCVSAETRR